MSVPKLKKKTLQNFPVTLKQKHDIQNFERVGSSQLILTIWTPKSHVKLINTRLYFRSVVSTKMRVC